jgi:hypothetical protein
VVLFINNYHYDMSVTNRNSYNHSTNDHYTENFCSNYDASIHSYSSRLSIDRINHAPPPFGADQPDPPNPTGQQRFITT